MSTGDLERRQLILEHIGLYRLSLAVTISKLFFNSGNPRNVVQRLVDKGFIQARSARAGTNLPGGYSYYQLTKEGTKAASVPEDRSKPFGDKELEKNLAFLWFCLMGDTKRARLSDALVREFLGGDLPDGDFCWERSKSSQNFLCFVSLASGSSTPSAYWVKRLRHIYDLTQKNRKLRGIYKAGLFRPVFLVYDSTREEELRESFLRSNAFPSAKEGAQSPILITQVPSQEKLPLALDELTKSAAKQKDPPKATR